MDRPEDAALPAVARATPLRGGAPMLEKNLAAYRNMLRPATQQGPGPANFTVLAPIPESATATEQARQRAYSRAFVVRQVERLQSELGLSERAACALLLEQAQGKRLSATAYAMLLQARDERGRSSTDAADALPTVRTLRRWVSCARSGGSLLPVPSADVRLQVRPWFGPLFALMDRPQKPTLRWAHEQLLRNWQPAWADAPGAAPPSYDQARRAYEKRSGLDKLKGRHTGSALRSRTMYQHRTYAGLQPFDEVHADGWTTHFTAPHPVTGEFVTREVWHFHDAATRYVTPLAVGMSESTDVILAGLRACIAVGGVMAVWQTDHTSSVKNARVRDEISGIAERLGVSVVHPAEVGNSQANGIAENFNTWLDREARELATYQAPERMDSGAFTRIRRITNAMVRAGAQGLPAERARLRAEAMRLGKGLVFDSDAEAVAWIEARASIWNSRPHRSLPKLSCPKTGRVRHMTPQESLDAALAAGWAPVALTPEQMTDVFRPHLRKHVRRGTVTPYGGQRYHHPDLAHHEGDEVLVAVDPDSPETVWVKSLDGRLLCVARLVEAVGPRTESMHEHSQRKRAAAQIRRRELQIEQIERAHAGMPLPLEMQGGAALLDGLYGVPAAAAAELLPALAQAPQPAAADARPVQVAAPLPEDEDEGQDPLQLYLARRAAEAKAERARRAAADLAAVAQALARAEAQARAEAADDDPDVFKRAAAG